MKTRRRYVMRARAEAAEETRRRVLQATFDLFWEKLSFEITLDDVAERADVSVQTVLRHFGSRAGLFDALDALSVDVIADERIAPEGGLSGELRALADHYELRGDAVIRLLSQEPWDDRVRRHTDLGRRKHREWVERVFAPQLSRLEPSPREALTDLLVVATHVYTWKLLRRDRALAREAVEQRVRHLVAVVIAAPPEVG